MSWKTYMVWPTKNSLNLISTPTMLYQGKINHVSSQGLWIFSFSACNVLTLDVCVISSFTSFVYLLPCLFIKKHLLQPLNPFYLVYFSL